MASGPADEIHVVDDDEAVRDSLRFLLESSGFAVVVHPSAEDFLALGTGRDIGCVLTDVRMPGVSGLALQRRLQVEAVPVAVIVMTGHGDVPLAVQAMKDGALDFLEKPFDDAALLQAVRRALAASRAMREQAASSRAAADKLAALTPRESEVLAGLVAGQSSKEIARDLGASPRTIEVHRTRVMAKLGVNSLPELVRTVHAARQGAPA
jgi:two-component system, LuxR family, response regulator FixJ